MSVKNGKVILATIVPVFKDGGDFLVCELVSGSKLWSFGIRWSDTEAAMFHCGKVLDAHRDKARNVKAFPYYSEGERPSRHQG